MYRKIILSLILSSSAAIAHEMTPTYPKFYPSYMDGISTTKMNLFNRRTDVDYYEISVFDNMWKPIKFATENRIIPLKYLEKVNIEIFIKKQDVKKVEYICTKSKLVKGNILTSGVSSRICSRVK